MRNKTCMICKMTINIPGDKYVKVKDMDEKDEVLSKGFYHNQCYRDRLNGSSNLQKLQQQAMSFLKGAKKKVGIKEDDEFEEVII